LGEFHSGHLPVSFATAVAWYGNLLRSQTWEGILRATCEGRK
jgi:hypothetical protein